jgi:hypothetical protein
LEILIQPVSGSTAPRGRKLLMTSKRWTKHKPEQIVAKLRAADAMLNTGRDLTTVLQALEISEATIPNS